MHSSKQIEQSLASAAANSTIEAITDKNGEQA